MNIISYENFNIYLFKRVTDVGNEWFFSDEYIEEIVPNNLIVNYSGEIFKGINKIGRTYTDIQLCHGLQYLIDPTCSLSSYAFFDLDVDETERIQCIRNMLIVFKDLFEKKCSSYLSHLQIDNKIKNHNGNSIYNSLCYMWWDLLPRHGVRYNKSLIQTDNIILNILEEILKINNIACKESALHGLGHWYSGCPDEVVDIIQRNSFNIPKELIAFSELAMKGDVQ